MPKGQQRCVTAFDEKNIACVHVELCRVLGRVRMLSFNTCGGRNKWLNSWEPLGENMKG